MAMVYVDTIAGYRQTCGSCPLAWSEGRRPTVLFCFPQTNHNEGRSVSFELRTNVVKKLLAVKRFHFFFSHFYLFSVYRVSHTSHILSPYHNTRIM